MKKLLTYYSLVFAITLACGEVLVTLKVNKYWPLTLDDFIGVAALLTAIVINLKHSATGYYLAAWAYIAGNIYAVLFMRLDPISGSGERIVLVSIVLGFAVLGCVLAFLVYRKEYSLIGTNPMNKNRPAPNQLERPQ